MTGYIPNSMVPYAAGGLSAMMAGRQMLDQGRQVLDYGTRMGNDAYSMGRDVYGNVTSWNPWASTQSNKTGFRGSAKRPYQGRAAQSGRQGRLTANPVKGTSTQKGRPRKKTKYCNQKKLCEEVSTTKRAVKQIQRVLNESTGVMRYRYFRLARMQASSNSQNAIFLTGSQNTDMKTYLAALMYKKDDGTFSTKPLNTALQNQFNIDSLTSKLKFRNNNAVDLHVKVYVCEAREDTSADPVVLWRNNEAVTYNGTGTILDVQTYPSDSKFVTNSWHLKLGFKGVLTPGQTAEVSHTSKDGTYDAGVATASGLAFQRSWKPFGFLIVMQGTLSHDDSNSSLVGLNQTELGYSLENVARISYDAGGDVEFVHIDQFFSAHTGLYIQSQKPKGANIASTVVPF